MTFEDRYTPMHPHLLGIDDGPVEKHVPKATTPIVGVMMEGASLLEAVAVTRFEVDGDDATGFFGDWIESLHFRPSLQGVVFGGITIAGLSIVDIRALSKRLALPVMTVNRRPPVDAPLVSALRSAGFEGRIPIVETAPEARPIAGIFAAAVGAPSNHIDALLKACIGKSQLPEPLRVAHLMARALVTGQSRGKP